MLKTAHLNFPGLEVLALAPQEDPASSDSNWGGGTGCPQHSAAKNASKHKS